jgi:hypothetical protein
MNERILELAKQSGLIQYDTDSKMNDVEKFAQLIVLECLSIVESNTYGSSGEYDYSYSDENSAADDRAETIYKEIAYRFGVK